VTVIVADFTSGDDFLVNGSLTDLGASDAYGAGQNLMPTLARGVPTGPILLEGDRWPMRSMPIGDAFLERLR